MPTLQHFELQILLALVRMSDETYTAPLVLALEADTERTVAPAAVFIALGRLEKKGLVSSRLDTAAGPRPRRYYKLTRAGLSAVKAHHVEYARLWRGLDRILGTRKV